MSQAADRYYQRESAPFILNGESQILEVIEQIIIPITNAGCHISAFNVSASGQWITTARISGQGEWGYDILRTNLLVRVGGVAQCRGYISEAPRFADDESRIAVLASRWLNWIDTEDETPSNGEIVNLGWLYFHRLPGLEETDHEVTVSLPPGWKAERERFQWHLPKDVTPVGDGVRMVAFGTAIVEFAGPLPEVIVLPTPHPSGKGVL